MASDLSSVCTDDIELFDEKEEGEISLEDVSSSEESHPNYRLGFRNAGRCMNCAALQQCSPWCNSARIARRKFHLRQDADHGKENRRNAKDTSGGYGKHSVSTLQEKNDDEDLVPISSDSDMETVGLPGNSIHVATRTATKSSKVRKKKKKKRNRGSSTARLEAAPESVIDAYDIGEEAAIAKAVRVGSSRSHHRESASPRCNVASASLVEKKLLRSPSRRYRTSTRGAKPRSPLRRSRSPVLNHANSTARKISRKLRASRRDASRSPVRVDLSREPRDSASSATHVDIYASKLLKKVRRLESVGNFSPKSNHSRSKEHSSLKEKLNNMMKNEEYVAARGDKKKLSSRRSTGLVEHDNNNVAHREHLEDDDIESLRRAALETKPKKRENKNEEATKRTSEPITRVEVNLSDDNDSEALELRMIALHSAVMNKHRNRVERGLGSKNRRFDAKTRNESPFGRSFLDAIPIPDELSDTSGQSPISESPARNGEVNNPEDMELDTDVEREKDSMPYSPTDHLTIGKIDNETVVAQPGPVLNNETIGQTNLPEESRVTKDSATCGTWTDASETAATNPKISTLVTKGAIKDAVKCRSSTERCTSVESLVNYLENPDCPYSPSKAVETSKNDRALRSPSKSMINVETPYSPTDAPIYDPELTRFSPDASLHLSKNSRALGATKNTDETSESGGEIPYSKVSSNLVPMMLNMSMNDDESPGCVAPKLATAPNDRLAERPIPKNAAADFYSNDTESMQFYQSIIDELPEIDLDGSPLVPVTKESSNIEFNIALSAIPDPEPPSEPLYLQGLPEVTREANKIPTLVNKTLVPSSILKTNKQLQQPLLPKKIESVIEPSFKSAEMRPVSDTEIAGLKSTKTFKPIKLCPLAKKPNVMTTNVAAFNSSLGDDTNPDGSANDKSNHPSAEGIKELAQKPETTVETTTPVSSTALKNPPNPEDASKKLMGLSADQVAPHGRSSESTGTVSSRSTSKVKAKSVEKYLGDTLEDRTNSRSRRAARRASSSPVLRERNLVKRRSSERTSHLPDLTMKKSEKMVRRDSVESGSEANASKTPRKRKIRTGRRKRHPSCERTDSNPGTGAKSVARRSSESAEKSKNETMDLDESVDYTVEGRDAMDPEVIRKDPEVASASLEKNNKEEVPNQEATSSDKRDKKDEADKKRRGSLDEDEEALRALLLASLPKRAKIAETTTPETINPIIRVMRLSDPTTTDTSLENSTEKLTKALGNDSPTFTTPTPLMLSSQSSSATTSSATSNKVADTHVTISKNVDAAKKILTNETNESSSNSSLTPSPLTPRKRSASVALKNPSKKILKKALPALASTRVVNNAKKYQNAMLQKRLNLQRAATSYNAATGSRNRTLNNIKSYENARPSSPKITNASSKTQRLVINLESDTDSDSELPASRLETKSSTSCNDTTTSEQRKPLAIPTTDFEESVVQFLKDQRKKIESIAVTTSAVASNVTTSSTKSPLPSCSGAKDIGMYSTPLAVRRHLPVSQQEEYRRLKQQIIERERQIQKTIDNGANSPSSPASPIVAATVPAKSYAPRVVPQVSVTHVASSSEKPQEKIDSIGAKSNITKVSQAIVPEMSVPSLSNVAVFSKVIPQSPSVVKKPAITSTPKGPIDITESASITKVAPANNTTGKNAVQPKTCNTTVGTVHPENATKSAKISSISSRFNGPPLSSASVIRNGSLQSASSMNSVNAASSTIGSSSGCLKATQTLTIQIPNDKIQVGESPAAIVKNKRDGTSEASINSPRSLGALRTLTKKQLNDRSVKIQVERSSGDRRVTVAPTRNLHDSSSSSIDVFAPSTSPKCPDDRAGQNVFCDSSLSLNERCGARRKETSSNNEDERSISGSEASTLVLSRNENVAGNNSNASTLVLSNDASQIRGHLESTRLCDEDVFTNARSKQHKTEGTEAWDKIRSDVKDELKILEALSADEKEQLLMENQENLVAKRNMVLEDLTEMTRYLRQLEFEREIQTKLVAEVRRLREQLKSAEDRLNEQRRQMNEMAPRVTRTHEKINHGRRECYRMSRICQGLGTQVVGQNYKVPVTNARLLNEQLKEVAAYTRQLSKKKVPALNNVLNNTRDVSLSPALASIVSTPDNSMASLSETVNRLDTPSTSMSETDNNDDTYEDTVPTRENETSIGDSDEPTNVPELEEEKRKDSSSTCLPDVPGENENEESSTIEMTNPSNEVEASGSAYINESISAIEVSTVSETNAPSEKMETPSPMETNSRSEETEAPSPMKINSRFEETEAPSPMEINSRFEETEVAKSPETNASTSQVEIPNSSVSNAAPPKETETSRLTEVDEASKNTEHSSTNSSCPVVDPPTTRNFFLDTTKSNEPASIGGKTISTGTNFVPIFQDTAVHNRTKNNFPTVSTRRSEPPSFPVLNDTHTGVKKTRGRYTSVLTHFRTLRNADPNGILCPYELMGTCNDGDCQYYHFDPDRQCQ